MVSFLSFLLLSTEAKMMSLVVPLFVLALADPSTPASKQRQALHIFALRQLMLIGPKHPSAFKAVMQSSPAAKERLEGAVRASQSPAEGGGRKAAAAAASVTLQAPPAIKLKMDFSNFK